MKEKKRASTPAGEIPPGPGPRTVLQAAAAVFAEEGFAGARVDAIAERAGVNKAMVYYHVGDKAHLYEAVFSGSLDHARNALDAALQGATTPEERLRAFVSTIARVARENPHLPTLILREFAGGGSNLPEAVLRKMGGLFRTLRQILQAGRVDASFRPVNPLLTHLVIAGSVMFLSASGPIMKRLGELERESPPADVSGDLGGPIADLLLNGLCSVRATSTADTNGTAGARHGRKTRTTPRRGQKIP